MSNPYAIEVCHVSKRFRIGQRGLMGHATLRDQIAAFFAPGQQTQTNAAEFLALDDVHFSVRPGEMVGIIGRNGAGKSTLLKILSRITPPTTGKVRVTGRLASLLEVGTGFHPELTGRENVFLNGAILGMNSVEIRSKFDQIVDFAGIEKFIDTPVKRYSSGMYIRLAFSVAAHLQPDILVVDEVLAVGDVAFQRKCAETMNSAARANRTVLLVSHNLQAIRTLCSRAILLDHGKVIKDSLPSEVLTDFVQLLQAPRDLSQDAVNDRRNRSSGKAEFTSFRIFDTLGAERYTFEPGQKAVLTLDIAVKKDVPGLSLYLLVRSALTGEEVTSVFRNVWDSPAFAGQHCQIDVEIPEILLRPGDYSFYICVGELNGGHWYDIIDQNVQLPLLTVVSEEKNILKTTGVFAQPTHVHFRFLEGTHDSCARDNAKREHVS